MFALAGCPNETPQPTPQPPPALVGSLSLPGGSTILIIQMTNVTDAQMAELVGGLNVVQRVQSGYGLLDEGQKTALVGKIDEIHIAPISLPAPGYSYKTEKGKKILTYRHNTPNTGVGSLLMNIATGTVTLAN
jgi:hypothetical protein